MPSQTPAQEEFSNFLAKNNDAENDNKPHSEDRDTEDRESADEEDQYRTSQIDAAMRMPTLDRDRTDGAGIKLPPVSFDSGRATGVKGVIADARSYEQARRSKWMDRARAVRRSVFGPDSLTGLSFGGGNSKGRASNKESESGGSSAAEEEDRDEESFLQQWRESRRKELEAETKTGVVVRNRRTSPSARLFGRLDEVDAMGYLDAIEKVGREVVVAVFVYDHECQVSEAIESALKPLVRDYPTVHFVKVHFEDIEFDNAAVPAILAYRNQGDLFANLTGLIEELKDEEDVTSETLYALLHRHDVL